MGIGFITDALGHWVWDIGAFGGIWACIWGIGAVGGIGALGAIEALAHWAFGVGALGIAAG